MDAMSEEIRGWFNMCVGYIAEIKRLKKILSDNGIEYVLGFSEAIQSEDNRQDKETVLSVHKSNDDNQY